MRRMREMKLVLLALSTAILLMLHENNAAARVVQQIRNGDSDLIVTCDQAPIASDYAAESASSIPLTDPCTVQRNADKGLVTLMSEGRRRVKSFIIQREAIKAIVSVKSSDIDRADLVFTQDHLTLVHTTTANGGIFTVSDVYELPYRAHGADEALIKSDPDLTKQVEIGLRVYDRAKGRCIAP